MKFVILLLSSCAIVRISDCVEFSRRASRRSLVDRNSPQLQSADKQTSSLIEGKLARIEKFDEKLANILARLDALDVKIDKVNDKLFNERISDQESLSINARLILQEKKLCEVDHKISRLINQTDKSDVLSDQLSELKLSGNVRTVDADQQLQEALEGIELGLSENGVKLEYVKRFLEIAFEPIVNKNVSRSDELLMQIQRKERRVANHSTLFNEVLSMVKERLPSERDDEGSTTDTVENTNSSILIQKTKTTRRNRLIFPNIKNKPPKINTSFVSDFHGARDTKGIKVSRAGIAITSLST